MNNWIYRVTGQAPDVTVPSVRPTALRLAIGEADEEPEKPKAKEDEKPPEAPPAPASIPEPAEQPAEPEAAVDAGAEPSGEPDAQGGLESQTVDHLVSSWESGSHMDVAAELLYAPVSYIDFVRMLFSIGPQDGMELGGLLDELSSVEAPGGGEETPSETSADRVLSRIARRRQEPIPAGTEPESTHAMP
jgi:hypothetical protein